MAGDKTLAQQYFEDVEALKSDGASNADAIRQVAEKYSKNENAVRGGIHQYKSKLSAGSTNGRSGRRKTPATVDDMIAQAAQSIETAINLIDREVVAAEQEVTDAEAALEAAKQRHAAVVEGVKQRKADLDTKLKALS